MIILSLLGKNENKKEEVFRKFIGPFETEEKILLWLKENGFTEEITFGIWKCPVKSSFHDLDGSCSADVDMVWAQQIVVRPSEHVNIKKSNNF